MRHRHVAVVGNRVQTNTKNTLMYISLLLYSYEPIHISRYRYVHIYIYIPIYITYLYTYIRVDTDTDVSPMAYMCGFPRFVGLGE